MADGDPSDKVWHMYLSDSEKKDVILAESLKGDADGVLIFVRDTFVEVLLL